MSVRRIGKSRYEVRCRYRKQNIKRKFDDKWEAQEFERLVLSDGMEPDRAFWTARGFGKPKETDAASSFSEFALNVWLPAKQTGDATHNGAPQSEKTHYYCTNQIKIALKLIGKIKIDRLTKSHYLDVKRRLLMEPLWEKGNKVKMYAPASANKVLKRMKECLRYAEEIGVIEISPWTNLRNIPLTRKDKVHWKKHECRKFLEVVKDRNHAHYCFFVLALSYGLRRSELFGLQLQDVDFVEKEIIVRRQWDEYWYGRYGKHKFTDTLKNGRPLKVLPLIDSAAECLKAHTKLMVGPATPLFNFGGAIMKTPRRLIEPYAKLAEVPSISIHRMRDSFISNMSREGVNEAIIAAIAGCTKDNLKHYQQFDSRDAKRALSAIDYGS